LRDFLAKNLRDTVVWYCHKPCQYVFKSIPDRVGATPRGFRCGRLTLDIDGKAAGDRAWRVELARLWLSVADLIQPFYAEIRTGECPTKSWWWNGIPTASPSALLIGRPYAELWPDFVSGARRSSTGLHYLEQFVEAAADHGENRIPSPPSNIAQPPETGEADRIRSVEAGGQGCHVPALQDAVSGNLAVRGSHFVGGWLPTR